MRTRLHALLLLAPVAACTADAPPPEPSAVRSASDVTDAVLEAARPDGNWLTYGGNYAEDRFSTLNEITRDNVDGLGLAWTYDIELRGGSRRRRSSWAASCTSVPRGAWSTRSIRGAESACGATTPAFRASAADWPAAAS